MSHADHVGREYYAHEDGEGCPWCEVERLAAERKTRLAAMARLCDCAVFELEPWALEPDAFIETATKLRASATCERRARELAEADAKKFARLVMNLTLERDRARKALEVAIAIMGVKRCDWDAALANEPWEE